MAFTEIPILDLSRADSPETKPAFLADLRSALLNVGFLYIKNCGIDLETFDKVCEQGIKFFDLPEEEKLKIEMKNQPSFLGYNRVCLPVLLGPEQGHPSPITRVNRRGDAGLTHHDSLETK